MAKIGADLSKAVIYLGVVENAKAIANCSIKIDENPYLGFDMLRGAISSYIYEFGVDGLIIEKPWVRSPFGLTATELMRTATFVELAAYSNNLDPVFVLPNVWRKVVYGANPKGDTKEAAREMAQQLLGYETRFKKEHNVCESLLLALYGELMYGR